MSHWTQPTLKNRICTYIFTYETIEYKQTRKGPYPHLPQHSGSQDIHRLGI